MEQFRKFARRTLQQKENAEAGTGTPAAEGEVTTKDLSSTVDTLATVYLIFVLLYIFGYIVGLIRLISNWQRFEGRNVGMLFVWFFIPFGFMWPLFAK